MAHNQDSNMVEVAPEQSAYETARKELHGSIDHLKGLVEHLRLRLGDALVNAPETAAGKDGSTIQPVRAPMISELEQQTARVDSISRDVDDILRRLCL